MDMKHCQIEYNVNGSRGRVIVDAEDSIAALLLWLETLPQSAGVRAIVKVLLPPKELH